MIAPQIPWDNSDASKNNKNYGANTGNVSSWIYFIGKDADDPVQTIHQRVTVDSGQIRVNPNAFTPIIEGDGFKIKVAKDPYNPVLEERYFWVAWK